MGEESVYDANTNLSRTVKKVPVGSPGGCLYFMNDNIGNSKIIYLSAFKSSKNEEEKKLPITY